MAKLEEIIQKIQEGVLSEEQGMAIFSSLHETIKKENTGHTISGNAFQGRLKTLMAQILKLNPEEIEPENNLSAYGFSSVTLTAFSHKITEVYSAIRLDPSVFMEHATLKDLSAFLYDRYSAVFSRSIQNNGTKNTSPEAFEFEIDLSLLESKTPSLPKKAEYSIEVKEEKDREFQPNRSEEIAIIGIGGRFPGAQNTHEFWNNLVHNKSCISKIPQDRWDWKKIFGDPNETNKTDCYHGAFIENVARFDPFHFNISPREAKLMDPQQRLLLEATWETLENAGYSKESLYAKKIGLFIGVERQDYLEVIRESGYPIDGHLNTGNAHAMLVNRIAYFFGWKGPALAIDAACASSFVAIHKAINSIQNAQAEMAVAGGIHLLLTPGVCIYNRKLGLFTGDDHVKPFDKDASGHFFGDALGLVFLKQLSSAIKDRDTIFGVIKGMSVRHGGQGMFLEAPNAISFKEVIQETLDQAKLCPDDIDYIEAQGTGNHLTDIMELKAYHSIFSNKSGKQTMLSTIKGHTGHFSGASGVISLIKAILSLKNNRLIKVNHLKNLNWSPDDGEFSCKILENTIDWKQKQHNGRPVSRRIGIHNFGFGGVNGHMILEEYIAPQIKNVIKNKEVIILSARTKEQIVLSAERLLDYLNTGVYDCYGISDIQLRDIAYTLQVGRQPMEERVIFWVDTLSELKEKLALWVKGNMDIEFICHGNTEESREVLQFLSDSDFKEVVEKWIKKRNFWQLGKLWVKGYKINWNLLHEETNTPQRICLPTYPFTQDSYWVPPPSNNLGEISPSSSTILTKQGTRGYLHPLVHENTSNFNEQRFSSMFTGQEFFLADRVVKGKNILPEAATLEIARVAVEQAVGTIDRDLTAIFLKDVVWAEPIAINSHAKDVHIGLFTQESGDIQFEIYTQPDDPKEGLTVHAQGVAILSSTSKAPILDISAIKAQCNKHSLSAEQCFETFRIIGIDYGPSYQGIEGFYIGHQQALVNLSLPPSVSEFHDQFILHPCLMDLAIQASIGLLSELSETSIEQTLPLALKELRIMGACTSSMWAWIRSSEESSPEDNARNLDIDFCDNQGNAVIILRGMIFQAGEVHPATGVDNLADIKSAMPIEVKGMIPTLNGTGSMTKTLSSYSESFANYAGQCDAEVLDVGCAYGVATIAALRRGARVLAIDMDQGHLDILEGDVSGEFKQRLSTQQGVLPDVDFEYERFAAIHAARVIHFLRPEDVQKTIQKMYHWLQPGGKLFLISDTPYFPHWAARVSEYEARKAKGDLWPGYIDNINKFFDDRDLVGGSNFLDSGKDAATALAGIDVINLLDPDTLNRECTEVGFKVEDVGYESLAIDIDGVKLRGGMEHVGVVAVKPLREKTSMYDEFAHTLRPIETPKVEASL